MSAPEDKDLLDAAEQLNDGTLKPDQQLSATDEAKQAVMEALLKINHVTRQIRSHGLMNSHQMHPGDQWAHLTIIDKIGHGGIGEVYEAYDPILVSQVAVKFLSKKSQLYISQQQFLDEARYMAKVRNPHVLAIHGATVDQGMAGYWSDYLNGDLLSDRLQQNPPNWQQQLRIAQQLCQALKAIHNNQLVHGDIKPLNVMLQPERGAILLDFGSSHNTQEPTTDESMQQASPMAMAPEQFEGQPASSATDVYALGLVFWQLSATCHPLDGMELTAIKKQVGQLHSFRKQIKGPKSWRLLIMAMTEPDPKIRPNILAVEASIQQIITSPATKAKRLATASVLVLALGITLISLFSNYKTTQAQQETEAMNTLLSDILMTSSPLKRGKDVLLVDVLLNAQDELINNQAISQRQRVKSLLQLLQTFRTHGNHKQALDLAGLMLANQDMTQSERLDLLMQNADTLNRTRQFDQSEALYKEALGIDPINKNDADVLVLTHVGLIKNYIETQQLKKIPPLLQSARSMWEHSNQKKSDLGLIDQIEGNFAESMKQFDQAFKFYQQAQQNFSAHYGSQNLNVLIAKGNAATVLTFTEETREQGATMLEELIAEMMAFLGPDHSSTLIARANLASIYGQLKRPQEGLDTIVPHLPSVYKAFGVDGGTTLAFENIVAEVYVVAGEWEQADKLFLKIIDVNTKRHGPSAKATLNARIKRVTYLQQTNQFDQANESLEEMWQLALAAHSDQDRMTLEIEGYLIWNNHLKGQEQALQDMVALRSRMAAILGESDPVTISTSQRIENMQKGIADRS